MPRPTDAEEFEQWKVLRSAAALLGLDEPGALPEVETQELLPEPTLLGVLRRSLGEQLEWLDRRLRRATASFTMRPSP
jgi:hypothetical protein